MMHNGASPPFTVAAEDGVPLSRLDHASRDDLTAAFALGPVFRGGVGLWRTEVPAKMPSTGSRRRRRRR